jgi:glycyl-tRNA synthetase (class II)
VDVQTVGDADKGEQGDQRVTIRDRDSMQQIRVPVRELVPVFQELLAGGDWAAVAGRFGGLAAGAAG